VSKANIEASIAQNVPNPVNGETSIRLYIPEGSKEAKLSIARIDGRLVEAIGIAASGIYLHTVTAGRLAAGVYVYSLVVDGQMVGARRMVVLQ
jgi:hypothetical protein